LAAYGKLPHSGSFLYPFGFDNREKVGKIGAKSDAKVLAKATRPKIAKAKKAASVVGG
jgi:hypothetical protein